MGMWGRRPTPTPLILLKKPSPIAKSNPPDIMPHRLPQWRDWPMPGTTERQRRFMGADLARKRAKKKTRTGMTEKQLRDYARKPKKRK